MVFFNDLDPVVDVIMLTTFTFKSIRSIVKNIYFIISIKISYKWKVTYSSVFEAVNVGAVNHDLLFKVIHLTNFEVSGLLVLLVLKKILHFS